MVVGGNQVFGWTMEGGIVRDFQVQRPGYWRCSLKIMQS
jgi:hypothetical protein